MLSHDANLALKQLASRRQTVTGVVTASSVSAIPRLYISTCAGIQEVVLYC